MGGLPVQMSKEEENRKGNPELELITTEELAWEILRRHDEAMVVASDNRNENLLKIKIKTQVTEFTHEDVGFDLTRVMELFFDSQRQLILEYMKAYKDE
jgi:hypothetical protein